MTTRQNVVRWKRVLTGFLLWAGMLVSPLAAQLSEFETTRFVPAETFIALSINMESILGKVDAGDPLIRKLLDSGTTSTGFNLGNLERLMFLVSAERSAEREFEMPALMLMRFTSEVDSAAILGKADSEEYLQYETSEYNGQQIHSGRYVFDSGVHSGPTLFFPDEYTVVQGDAGVIRQMIDGESEMSSGMDLVNNLDPEAELQLVIEGGSGLQSFSMETLEIMMPGASQFSELVYGLRHLEVLASYQEEIPVSITIEMKSEALANQVMGLLNAGRLAAPGALEGLSGELDKEMSRFADRVDSDLMARGVGAVEELLALGKTALEKLNVQQDGATIVISVPEIEGLEQLPQLTGMSMGMSVVAAEAMMAQYERHATELEEMESAIDPDK